MQPYNILNDRFWWGSNAAAGRSVRFEKQKKVGEFFANGWSMMMDGVRNSQVQPGNSKRSQGHAAA